MRFHQALSLFHQKINIKLHMVGTKLDMNSSTPSASTNIDSFGKSTLKGIIEDIVGVTSDLLQYAAGVAIPNHITTKMKKKHIIWRHLIDMWGTSSDSYSPGKLSLMSGRIKSTITCI